MSPENYNKLLEIIKQEGALVVVKAIDAYLRNRVIEYQKPMAQSLLDSVAATPTVSSLNTINSLSNPLWWNK